MADFAQNRTVPSLVDEKNEYGDENPHFLSNKFILYFIWPHFCTFIVAIVPDVGVILVFSSDWSKCSPKSYPF